MDEFFETHVEGKNVAKILAFEKFNVTFPGVKPHRNRFHKYVLCCKISIKLFFSVNNFATQWITTNL